MLLVGATFSETKYFKSTSAATSQDERMNSQAGARRSASLAKQEMKGPIAADIPE
jgi:hypothetical protein